MPQPPARPLPVFLGHHKCATSWINTITEDISRSLGLKFCVVSNAREFDNDLAGFIAEHKVDVLSYINAKIEHVGSLTNFRGFHVIRDPRDIVVSAYFSHLNSHPTTNWPELASHREKLRNASKDEGLFIEMGFRKNELDDLDRWDYHQPNVMELKMEELIANPYERLLEAFSFLGLAEERTRSARLEMQAASARWLRARTRGYFPAGWAPSRLSIGEVLAIAYRNRFSAKASGRQPGVEDVNSHYRKGVAGDWVNHLNPANREYFKNNYGPLLQKLGYEKSLDW